MPIMEISIVPVGTGTPSVSKYVAKAFRVLKKEKGIEYKLTSMGTIIEADTIEKLLELVRKMHREVLQGEVKRAVITVKIDDRVDKRLTINGKVSSVRSKLRGKV